MQNLVLDLDGTIIFNGQALQPDIAESLERAQQRGSRLVFATARPLRDTLPLLPAQLQQGLIIGCNGAMISDAGQVNQWARFADLGIRLILAELERRQVPYLVDSRTDYAISSTPHAFHRQVMALGHAPVPLDAVLNQGVSKVLVLAPSCRVWVEMLAQQELAEYAIYTHQTDACWDLVPAQSNKLHALRGQGIDMSQTLCFGNDHNDVEMLNAAAQAVVVGSRLTLAREHHRVAEHEISDFLRRLTAA